MKIIIIALLFDDNFYLKLNNYWYLNLCNIMLAILILNFNFQE